MADKASLAEVVDDRPYVLTAGSPLTRKLAEIMQAVERVPKRGRNTFHGYQYATEADIADTVRAELAKRGVVIYSAIDRTMTREAEGETGKKSNYVTVEMTFTVVDGGSGEERSFRWEGAGQDRGEKGLYKAITGAEKYFLLKLFLIPTGDDPEDDTRDHKTAPKHTATPPAREPGDEPPDFEPPDDHAARSARLGQPVPGSPTISEKQQKRLFAIAKGAGWTTETLKTRLQSFGYEHSRDIPVAHYDDIVADLQAAGAK